MPIAPYRNGDEARAALHKALRESGFNTALIDIIPLLTCTTKHEQLEDSVDLHFPINEEGRTAYKVTGTYEVILAAIAESKTFDELATNCHKRGLKVVSKSP